MYIEFSLILFNKRDDVAIQVLNFISDMSDRVIVRAKYQYMITIKKTAVKGSDRQSKII